MYSRVLMVLDKPRSSLKMLGFALVLVLGLLFSQRGSTVEACLTPVFRYALERWDADSYVVEVFYRGTLSDEASKALDLLADYANRAKGPANLTVQRVDLMKVPDGSVEIDGLEGLGAGQTRMLVYNPRDTEKLRPVWSAPLTVEAVRQLVDSPMRREIASRLVRGDSAVWILLESGDREKDESAAAVLDEQLAALENSLKLPGVGQAEEAEASSPYRYMSRVSPNSGLRISFSSVRLKRDDPQEEFLVASLMPPDANEPVVFPVFGRGRALCALVGEHINGGNISSAGSFLVDACSCQVKWMNPGIDLLFATEWEKIWESAEPIKEPEPRLVGVGSVLPAGEHPSSSANTVGESSVSGTVPESVDLGKSIVIVLGSALALVIVGTVVVHAVRAKREGSRRISESDG